MLRHYFQWHILHACNLSCRHCYQEDTTKMMSLEKMRFVLDKYDTYIKLHRYEGQINLTGGEPLLHPDFFDIAEEIRARGIRLGVLTNGTLIDENIAKKLAALKPVFVQISLDGTKEIHDEIRGAGQFERALLGVDLLKAQGVRVLISFTAMKGNADSFSELAKICKKHRVDKLWWDRVVTKDSELFLSTEEFKRFNRLTSRLKRRFPFISNDRALQGLPEDVCGYKCSAGKRLLIVLANGDMMACRRLPFVIGNILTETPLENELRSNSIMEMLARPSFPEGCRNCKHFENCGGGAKCVTYAQTGKLGIRDVNCYL